MTRLSAEQLAREIHGIRLSLDAVALPNGRSYAHTNLEQVEAHIEALEAEIERLHGQIRAAGGLAEALDWAITETFTYVTIDGQDYVPLTEWFRRIERMEAASAAYRTTTKE